MSKVNRIDIEIENGHTFQSNEIEVMANVIEVEPQNEKVKA